LAREQTTQGSKKKIVLGMGCLVLLDRVDWLMSLGLVSSRVEQVTKLSRKKKYGTTNAAKEEPNRWKEKDTCRPSEDIGG